MEKTAYLASAYLAPVEYYTKFLHYQQVYIEQWDHYQKQTYRNRCTIASADGPLVLSIPVIKTGSPKCLMKDIRISDHGNWRHLHWNALEAAYGNSPFFEYYQDDLRPFYEHTYKYLYDFNWELCTLICQLIDIQPVLLPTCDYKNSFSPEEADFREIIHPKKEYKLLDPCFQAKPYYQVFQTKQGFIPNLSIVDLLFNMGPESLIILQQGIS